MFAGSSTMFPPDHSAEGIRWEEASWEEASWEATATATAPAAATDMLWVPLPSSQQVARRHSFSNELYRHPVAAFDDEGDDDVQGDGAASPPSRPVVARVVSASNLTPSPSPTTGPTAQKAKKAKKKNPKASSPRVRRPLSAYNLFFRDERARLLAVLPVRKEGKPRRSHGKLGFVAMAKQIGAKWKALDASTRAPYDSLATQEKARYASEKKQQKQQQQQQQREMQQLDPPPAPAPSSSADLNMPVELERVWTMEELATKLGPSGVALVTKAFLGP